MRDGEDFVGILTKQNTVIKYVKHVPALNPTCDPSEVFHKLVIRLFIV